MPFAKLESIETKLDVESGRVDSILGRLDHIDANFDALLRRIDYRDGDMKLIVDEMRILSRRFLLLEEIVCKAIERSAK
jgi:hypothetical protein